MADFQGILRAVADVRVPAWPGPARPGHPVVGRLASCKGPNSQGGRSAPPGEDGPVADRASVGTRAGGPRMAASAAGKARAEREPSVRRPPDEYPEPGCYDCSDLPCAGRWDMFTCWYDIAR